MKYSVIIVAAGKGTRTKLEYNKVFYNAGTGPIICNTILPFIEDDDCEKIIMSISANEQEAYENIIQNEKIIYTQGGATRQESSYLGLHEVKTEYVMIHDGVRPFLPKENLEALKEALHDYTAALLMVPLIDTIKEVKDGIVVRTPNRSDFYCAQTPQAFKTALIKDCHEKAQHAGVHVSDDAQVVELFSDASIKVVEGSYENLKVTTQHDLKHIQKYTQESR